MTYSTIANLISGQRPFFLYAFRRGTQEYLFTNKKFNITKSVSGITGTSWISEVISHSKIIDSDQAFRTALEVTLPLSNQFAFNQLGKQEFIALRLTIWKGYLNDPDEELVVQFSGQVLNASPDKSSGKISFTAMTEIAALQRKGLVAVIQRPCRHVHYGRGCLLDLDTFLTADTIVSISANGKTVTLTSANAQADGYFNLGVFKWGNNLEMIISHVGNVVTLGSDISGLVQAVADGSVEVSIAPGCNLSRSICDVRFTNILNFGGFPHISDNPFSGKQVF